MKKILLIASMLSPQAFASTPDQMANLMEAIDRCRSAVETHARTSEAMSTGPGSVVRTNHYDTKILRSHIPAIERELLRSLDAFEYAAQTYPSLESDRAFRKGCASTFGALNVVSYAQQESIRSNTFRPSDLTAVYNELNMAISDNECL